MKQVSTDTKCSSSEKSTDAANAPETAPKGDSARSESPVILPGKLEHWNIDRLRPYERNPRTHSPEQITKIAASLLEFGWTNPSLVDGDAGIIAGHGRLAAARKLGYRQITLVTNGVTLSIPGVLDKLVESGVTAVGISFDALVEDLCRDALLRRGLPVPD